jgi:mannose-6-phosphate isomerase-like protein (cupin superfamily)
MRETVVEKLWGTETVIHNDEKYCMKILDLNYNWQSSLHMHRKKEETFLVVSGIVELEVEGKGKFVLKPSMYYTILPGTYHRFRALTNVASIVEASTQHFEDDVMRKEPSRQIEAMAGIDHKIWKPPTRH